MGRFVVWSTDQDDTEGDGKKISAFDAREAVMQWAEWKDHYSAEYLIVGGQPEKVMVRDLDTNDMYPFEVSGVSVPHYTARCLHPFGGPLRSAPEGSLEGDPIDADFGDDEDHDCGEDTCCCDLDA